MNREEALVLLKEHVKSESLLRHSYAVEAGMRAYASHFDEDVEAWGLLGLLHDIDFEKYPEDHPTRAGEILEPKGFETEFIEDILSHGPANTAMRTNNMRKTLSAVDQMSGFILAVARMRPTKLEGLKAKSVKKKMKDKAFAKAVSREDLEANREALGMELADHVTIIVNGLIEQEAKLQIENFSLLG